MKKVFIDGREGTTGLEIYSRLTAHPAVEILSIDESDRKNPVAKKEIMDEADLVFLCLPDEAARNSAALIEKSSTIIIDASTAHRTTPGWVYGLPELNAYARIRIENGQRISNPGCHATAFNLIVHPLVRMGIIPDDYPITAHSVTGYSGGGKAMIAEYESFADDASRFDAPRHYSLGLTHKHLPEMRSISGLCYDPLFNPIVGNFYRGLSLFVPLFKRLIGGIDTETIHRELTDYYVDETFVRVMPFTAIDSLDKGRLDPTMVNGTNEVRLFVFGSGDCIEIAAVLDNLGKGASGAAIQNMNLALGFDETLGLVA